MKCKVDGRRSMIGSPGVPKMRALFGIAVALTLVACSGTAALAQKRVALVVGNSAYQNAPKLANPARDADAVARMLKAAAFDVVEARNDIEFTAFRRVLRDFSDKTRDADMAVIYYAGHGIEVEGSNYLVPIDAVLERDRDAQDEAISLERVLQTIEPAKSLRLVILDACRENPFTRKMKRTVATRALDRGFASVEPNQPNTLIAFAAKAGSTADDGSGENSPFTTSLLKHLTTPGLDLRKAFGRVRDEVMQATSGKQEPFVYGSLGGSDVSLVAALSSERAVTVPSDVQDVARREYELAERVGTREVWTSFLSRHGDGFFAEMARGQLRKIEADEQRLVALDQAKRAADEKARLAAQGAPKAEQRKAATEAKKAEDARLAAEKRKAAAEAKLAKADSARSAADNSAADRSRGGRSCTSTHTECVFLSKPLGQSWVNNCERRRHACMQTGQWIGGLRDYYNVSRR
jgi:uncharacterized caspase-like protein